MSKNFNQFYINAWLLKIIKWLVPCCYALLRAKYWNIFSHKNNYPLKSSMIFKLGSTYRHLFSLMSIHSFIFILVLIINTHKFKLKAICTHIRNEKKIPKMWVHIAIYMYSWVHVKSYVYSCVSTHSSTRKI